MKAVILSGGYGRRMGNLAEKNQKTMIRIGGKPIIEHMIRKLSTAGITEIIIVVGYKKEQVIEYFSNGERFGLKISYVLNKNAGSGTAVALLEVENQINDLFIAVNGDTYIQTDLKEFIGVNKPCICVSDVEDVSNFGRIYEENGILVDIIEKEGRGPGIANVGLYMLQPSIFDAIRLTKRSKRSEFELTDSIMISKKDFGTKYSIYKLNGPWVNIGTQKDLERTREIFEKQVNKKRKTKLNLFKSSIPIS